MPASLGISIIDEIVMIYARLLDWFADPNSTHSLEGDLEAYANAQSEALSLYDGTDEMAIETLAAIQYRCFDVAFDMMMKRHDAKV